MSGQALQEGTVIRPKRPLLSARFNYFVHRALHADGLKYKLAARLEATPWAYRAFTWMERRSKEQIFGCRMCAQCALPATAYACPMTCPKQLRNGPCGGVTATGNCEVFPDTRCVWVIAYERAAGEGRTADLRRLQRPIDQRKWGQSSWINYWLGRDARLWTETPGLEQDELVV